MRDRPRSRKVRKAIEEDDIQSCVHGSEDVSVEVVAYHQGFLPVSSGFLKGVVEELWRGFVGSCILTQDDGIESLFQSAGTQLTILHFMETIAAHMEPVATAAQIVHKLVCTLHRPWLVGTALKEVVVHLQAVVVSGHETLGQTERMAESLHDEIVAGRLAPRIAAQRSMFVRQ